MLCCQRLLLVHSLPKATSGRWVQFRQCTTDKSQWKNSDNPLLRYLGSLKWVPIPLTVGFAYIGYQQYGHVVKREKRLLQENKDPANLVAKDWQVNVYRALPLNIISRTWGRINNLELPSWLQKPVLRLYIRLFGCNMEEAAIQELDYYHNLGELFRRRLRPSCRPVDREAALTSPSDGRILHFGKVDCGHVEQVKGVTYPLPDFLGPASWTKPSDQNNNNSNISHIGGETATKDCAQFEASLKHNKDNELYHCVVYLAPGDYHGFHSPSHWTVVFRRHFPGDLLSVSPTIAKWIRGLFSLNERAVYFGQWQHGFFSLVAVGATNVGSIKVYHDKTLCTNASISSSKGEYHDEAFFATDRIGIPMQKGEPFGEFNLGSTIVLIFEAPKDFKFNITDGQKIRYGQPLGCCKTEKQES